jgi:membrane protease YdiL (CAAX protease family)
MRGTLSRAGINRSDDRPFIVGISFIFLFSIAVMTAIITLTSLQVTQGPVYDAALLQLMIGMAGLGLGFGLTKVGVVKIELSETYDSLWSWERGWVVWGIICFAGIRLANFIVQGIFIPQITLSMSMTEVLNIVLSAGVFEDALLSLGFCTFLYLGWKVGPGIQVSKYFDRTIAKVVGLIFISVIASLVFSAMHIGAGYTDAQLMYVFISRTVLSLGYLKTKNIMTPVSAHMLHNLLLFLVGI